MRCLSVWLFAFAVAAAGEPTGPEGFWPLPRPGWLQAAAFPPLLSVQRVRPNLPAGEAGVEANDLVISIGDFHPLEQSEFLSALEVVAQRGDDRGSVRQAGKVLDLHLPAFKARCRWGVEFTAPAPGPAPAGLTPARVAAWNRLPVRARAAAERVIATTVERGWLEVLLDLQGAIDGGALPPDSAMPDPFLARLAAWWRTWLTADGKVPPVEDADEAIFRATYLPWPHEPPAAFGAVTTGDAEFDRLLRTLAEDRPVIHEQAVEAAQRAVDGIAGNSEREGRMIGQCVAAILDPPNHAGWPFRSHYIHRPEQRDLTLPALERLAASRPELAPFCHFARLSSTVIEGDAAALEQAMAPLSEASPWLARIGVGMLCDTARHWRKDAWTVDQLLAMPAGRWTPALRRKLAWMRRHPTMSPIEGLAGEAPPMVSSLDETWSQWQAWSTAQAAGRALATRLDPLVRALALDPCARDSDDALALSRQLIAAAGGKAMPYLQCDTVAAAFACSGQMAPALSWQQAALSSLEDQWQFLRADRVRHQAELGKRRQDYAVGRFDRTGPPDATPVTRPLTGGSSTSGREVAGSPIGIWRVQAANGVVLREFGVINAKPTGRWTRRDADGSLRWRGWIEAGARLGWWVVRCQDGGHASGWYDGNVDGKRCGLWRLYRADGTASAEGPCQQGKPVPPWVAIAADGTRSPLPAGQVKLPDDPYVPFSIFQATSGL